MKVSELIDMLECMSPNMEVHIGYNYGDYWRTEVAPAVDNVDVIKVVYSEYHQMDRVNEDDSDCEDVRRVVVLR